MKLEEANSLLLSNTSEVNVIFVSPAPPVMLWSPLFFTWKREVNHAPLGAAKVPSHLKNVVVLFGGVGTHPPTVAVIVATLPVAIGVEKVCTHVKVCAESVRAILALVVGNVIVVLSVPARVSVLFTVTVLLSAIVRVAAVAGAVRATLFIEVAVATQRTGVISVGVLSTTNLVPVPV